MSLSSLLIAAPETSAAAAKPTISANGTKCLYTLNTKNSNTIMINTLTASAFSKLTNTADASILFLCAILEATNAAIATAAPPSNADSPACKPDIANEAIATIAVAINCKRNILLKTAAVVVFSVICN